MSVTPLIDRFQKLSGVRLYESHESKLQALVAEQVALAVAPILTGFRGVRVMDQDDLRIMILYCGGNYARAAMHTLLDMHEREQQEQKGGDE